MIENLKDLTAGFLPASTHFRLKKIRLFHLFHQSSIASWMNRDVRKQNTYACSSPSKISK